MATTPAGLALALFVMLEQMALTLQITVLTLLLLVRNMHKDRVTPPILGGQPIFGQFPHNAIGLPVGFLNLVIG